MKHTKENTLYLPINQVYFDQIIDGTKTEEFREIKAGITASRYLIKDAKTKYKLDPYFTDPEKEYFIDDFNGGNFPFLPKPYKFLYLAVGYAKERDTAIVEVAGCSFLSCMKSKKQATWLIEYKLGKVVTVCRKRDISSRTRTRE